MSQFSRFLSSKKGMQTLIAVAAILVVIAVVGQLLGWWAALARRRLHMPAYVLRRDHRLQPGWHN
jgi:ABC-type xylose transport system permease subunit